LSFVYQVLWFAGLILLILVGVIAWFIGRVVVGPIKVTASTSKKIAAGDLSARVPEVGDDVLAELARNFNDMAQSMQRQVTNLEDLSSMQQRFVSDVSHELKTPLTTIKMASDYLYDKRADFDLGTNKSLIQLHESVDRFQGLLSDLLEISRYDAGTVRLDLEPTNMVALVNEVVAALGSIASERGSSIDVVAPGGHSDVLVDPRRIRRIVTNLVANAIEHGEGHPIVIEIDSNAEAVSVVVDDRGVGMTAEQAAQVFNRFYRADPARPRTIGGTGLGLSISFEDARIHNGKLEVWAAPGEGARFMLTVPRKPSMRWKSTALALARPGVFDA
jgi:two-component system sensor histidine kinase MtrB